VYRCCFSWCGLWAKIVWIVTLISNLTVWYVMKLVIWCCMKPSFTTCSQLLVCVHVMIESVVCCLWKANSSSLVVFIFSTCSCCYHSQCCPLTRWSCQSGCMTKAKQSLTIAVIMCCTMENYFADKPYILLVSKWQWINSEFYPQNIYTVSELKCGQNSNTFRYITAQQWHISL